MKKNLLLKWFAVRIEMDWVFIKPLSKLAAYLKKDAREIENKYIQISNMI